MKLKPLGRTGLFVSELCLGTMTFGGEGSSMWKTIGGLGQDAATALVPDSRRVWVATMEDPTPRNAPRRTSETLRIIREPSHWGFWPTKAPDRWSRRLF